MSFLDFTMGHQKQYDILCGTSRGDLSIVTDGNYLTVKEQAHYKMINVVKLYKVPRFMIITCGEDEAIRIWDNQFNLVNEIKLRTLSFLKNIPVDQNVSA